MISWETPGRLAKTTLCFPLTCSNAAYISREREQRPQSRVRDTVLIVITHHEGTCASVTRPGVSQQTEFLKWAGTVRELLSPGHDWESGPLVSVSTPESWYLPSPAILFFTVKMCLNPQLDFVRVSMISCFALRTLAPSSHLSEPQLSAFQDPSWYKVDCRGSTRVP